MEKILLVQISACIAETLTFPIDYTKTLLQVNKNKSIKPVLKELYTNKRNIYNGLKPALVRHSFYTTSRINLYEYLRNNTNTSNSNGFIYKFAIGGLSGGISQLLVSPLDL